MAAMEETVRVFCRLKPALRKKKECATASSPKQVHIWAKDMDAKYDFHGVLAGSASQEDVYSRSIFPLLPGLLEGKNASVLCYGQTGSGKTYTLFGPADNPFDSGEEAGIIPRIGSDLFRLTEGRFAVEVSFFEIYCDKLFDLLSPHRQKVGCSGLRQRSVQLRMCDLGDTIFVKNATEVQVNSTADLQREVKAAFAARATASTQSNWVSSRSHAVLVLTITGEKSVSQLYLADLAGSERVSKTEAQGQRLQEAGRINQSLMALRHVINALSDATISDRRGSRAGSAAEAGKRKKSAKTKGSKKPMIAGFHYRQNVLTRLLKHSFGGNGRTAMICTINPDQRHYEESLATLRFGLTCQNIRNQVTKNIVHRSLAEMVELLKQAEETIESRDAQLQRLQRRLAVFDGLKRLSDNRGDSASTLLHLHLSCPLTHRIFEDPVVCEDTVTYERSAVEDFFDRYGAVSPSTLLPLSSPRLIENSVVSALVRQMVKGPSAQPEAEAEVGLNVLQLPFEVVHQIFLRLDNVKSCALVCRDWAAVLDDPVFWRRKCKLLSISCPPDRSYRNAYNQYAIRWKRELPCSPPAFAIPGGVVLG